MICFAVFHVFHKHVIMSSLCFKRFKIFRIKHFASREKLLHAELETFAKSSSAQSFYPSAYCVLLCQRLFRYRGYEPERVLTSASAKQQTLHLRGVSAFSVLSLFYMDALSTNVSSHRAFLETKVAQLPLRQHQVYELASGRQRIVGGDLDSNPA